MRRSGIGTYFLSLLCVVGLTVALLPACGGGGGESCNSADGEIEGNEAACDAEEIDEEVDAAAEEAQDEAAEELEPAEDEEEDSEDEEDFDELNI